MNPFDDDLYARDDDGNMTYEYYSHPEGNATWPIETDPDVYDSKLDQFGWL